MYMDPTVSWTGECLWEQFIIKEILVKALTRSAILNSGRIWNFIQSSELGACYEVVYFCSRKLCLFYIVAFIKTTKYGLYIFKECHRFLVPYHIYSLKYNRIRKERQNRKDENSEVKCPFFIGKKILFLTFLLREYFRDKKAYNTESLALLNIFPGSWEGKKKMIICAFILCWFWLKF